MMQAQDIWRDITESKGKRILGRTPFFFQFIQLEIVLFHYLLPKFLENNTRQEGGISWYAIFQGVGRLLTAF